MDKVINFIREHAWSFYLGAGTTLISDKGLGDWQWWAFTAPVIILVYIRPKDNY